MGRRKRKNREEAKTEEKRKKKKEKKAMGTELKLNWGKWVLEEIWREMKAYK